MGTKVNFGGKTLKQPGVYTDIKSGITNPPVTLSYGNVLIIDTGSGANYGVGSGIAGTIQKDIAAIEEFQKISNFRKMVRGGMWWKASQWLWQPKNVSLPGISKLFYIKAAKTTPAEITYEFGDYDSSGSFLKGGDFTVQVRNEGLVGNGVEVSSVLTRGFAGRMVAGPNANAVTPDKFIIKWYAGTFKGLDSDGNPWDDILEEDTEPELLVTSVEFSTLTELVKWMNENASFNKYFKLKESNVVGTGVVDNADLIANSGNNLATGGTETFNTTYLNQVLDDITDLDYTHILCDKWGDDAKGVENGLILAHIVQEARYDKYMVVGGGKNEDKWTGTNGTLSIAEYFNSERVICVHAGFKKVNQTGSGFKEYDSIFKAAAVLGRTVGLEPQTPSTFKSIDMDADMDNLNALQQDNAVDHGVLFTKYDVELKDFIINQSINTLQENDFMVNRDGTSYEWSVERIKAQLNKEIIYNAKRDLFGGEDGPNRNTISTVGVKEWLDTFLTSKHATQDNDNLIILHQNITVEAIGDTYKINYEFEPNFPVNKLLFTGVIIDPTL